MDWTAGEGRGLARGKFHGDSVLTSRIPTPSLFRRRFGIKTGVLSPEMAKNLLRRSGEELEAAVRANVNLAVDLFMFCFDKDPVAWREMVGLRILPLMTGKLGVVGKMDAIVATREQQVSEGEEALHIPSASIFLTS